jgi:hypothetical protein
LLRSAVRRFIPFHHGEQLLARAATTARRTRQLSRQRVDGQYGGFLCRQLLHQLGVLGRPHEADHGATLALQIGVL